MSNGVIQTAKREEVMSRREKENYHVVSSGLQNGHGLEAQGNHSEKITEQQEARTIQAKKSLNYLVGKRLLTSHTSGLVYVDKVQCPPHRATQ